MENILLCISLSAQTGALYVSLRHSSSLHHQNFLQQKHWITNIVSLQLKTANNSQHNSTHANQCNRDSLAYLTQHVRGYLLRFEAYYTFYMGGSEISLSHSHWRVVSSGPRGAVTTPIPVSSSSFSTSSSSSSSSLSGALYITMCHQRPR